MPTIFYAVAAIACYPLYGTTSHGFIFGQNLKARARRAILFRTTVRPQHHQSLSGAKPNIMMYSVLDDAKNNNAEPVLGTASVDYSAANDYILAHYNQSQYFGSLGVGGDNGTSVEQIHDGRVLQSGYHDEIEMLKENGLAIIQSPMPNNGPKWAELEDIQISYVPELERIIRGALFQSKLMSCCFWNPMTRGETYEISREAGGLHAKLTTPTANIASSAHIDTDVGAYESIREFLDIVEKNEVAQPQSRTTAFESSKTPTARLGFEEMADAIIDEGKRFAVINFWRNIGDEPVKRAPLAILSTRYPANDLQRQHTYLAAFPNARPSTEESKWYSFPNATKDEVIVFYQYDRNVMQPSDLWHCAISNPNRANTNGDGQRQQQQQQQQHLTPRRSFDIRALVVLDEVVPRKLDRFSSNRTRPMLTFEESGCFCDEQAANRNTDKTDTQK